MRMQSFNPYRSNASTHNYWVYWVTFWLLVLVAAHLLSSTSNEARYGDLMRRTFHVPEQIEFAEMRYPRRGTANGIEGIFQLTEVQFAEYRARLREAQVWNDRRVELSRRTYEGPFDQNAFAWKPLPQAALAGNRRVRWGNLSRREIYKIKRGLAMCAAFRKEPGQRKSDWWFEAPKGHENRFPLYTPSRLNRYTAIHCADMGRSERPTAMLQAVLDFDTRRLHVTIR